MILLKKLKIARENSLIYNIPNRINIKI